MDEEKIIEELMATSAMSYNELNYLVNRIVKYTEYKERVINECWQVIEHKMANNVSIQDAYKHWNIKKRIEANLIRTSRVMNELSFNMENMSNAMLNAGLIFKSASINIKNMSNSTTDSDML